MIISMPRRAMIFINRLILLLKESFSGLSRFPRTDVNSVSSPYLADSFKFYLKLLLSFLPFPILFKELSVTCERSVLFRDGD